MRLVLPRHILSARSVILERYLTAPFPAEPEPGVDGDRAVDGQHVLGEYLYEEVFTAQLGLELVDLHALAHQPCLYVCLVVLWTGEAAIKVGRVVQHSSPDSRHFFARESARAVATILSIPLAIVHLGPFDDVCALEDDLLTAFAAAPVFERAARAREVFCVPDWTALSHGDTDNNDIDDMSSITPVADIVRIAKRLVESSLPGHLRLHRFERYPIAARARYAGRLLRCAELRSLDDNTVYIVARADSLKVGVGNGRRVDHVLGTAAVGRRSSPDLAESDAERFPLRLFLLRETVDGPSFVERDVDEFVAPGRIALDRPRDQAELQSAPGQSLPLDLIEALCHRLAERHPDLTSPRDNELFISERPNVNIAGVLDDLLARFGVIVQAVQEDAAEIALAETATRRDQAIFEIHARLGDACTSANDDKACVFCLDGHYVSFAVEAAEELEIVFAEAQALGLCGCAAAEHVCAASLPLLAGRACLCGPCATRLGVGLQALAPVCSCGNSASLWPVALGAEASDAEIDDHMRLHGYTSCAACLGARDMTLLWRRPARACIKCDSAPATHRGALGGPATHCHACADGLVDKRRRVCGACTPAALSAGQFVADDVAPLTMPVVGGEDECLAHRDGLPLPQAVAVPLAQVVGDARLRRLVFGEGGAIDGGEGGDRTRVWLYASACVHEFLDVLPRGCPDCARARLERAVRPVRVAAGDARCNVDGCTNTVAFGRFHDGVELLVCLSHRLPRMSPLRNARACRACVETLRGGDELPFLLTLFAAIPQQRAGGGGLCVRHLILQGDAPRPLLCGVCHVACESLTANGKCPACRNAPRRAHRCGRCGELSRTAAEANADADGVCPACEYESPRVRMRPGE